MIDEIRAEIEEIDQELLRLLARRHALGRAAGASKRAAGLPVMDPEREADVVARAAAGARTLRISEEEIRKIFWGVVHLCRSAQHEEERAETG
jgi:chorismate mutase